MNAREFFFKVAELRDVQKMYFETHDRRVFLQCRAIENEIDREIKRVRSIINDNEVGT